MDKFLTHAWRSWKSAKSVGLLAAIALAIGIGSATAVYTVVEAVLLKPVAGVLARWPSADPPLTSITVGELQAMQDAGAGRVVDAYLAEAVCLTGVTVIVRAPGRSRRSPALIHVAQRRTLCRGSLVVTTAPMPAERARRLAAAGPCGPAQSSGRRPLPGRSRRPLGTRLRRTFECCVLVSLPSRPAPDSGPRLSLARFFRVRTALCLASEIGGSSCRKPVRSSYRMDPRCSESATFTRGL